MSAAQRLMLLDPTKSIVPFGDGTNHQFEHTDMKGWGQPSGISVEEGEFLYGLVRILKPTFVVETGTNIGISASYMLLAMQDNDRGHLTTIEHDSTVAELAQVKLSSMGFKNYGILNIKVSDHLNMINSYGDVKPPIPTIDFLWLDTELKERFMELVNYFPHMKPGAVACIHDIWHLDFKEFGAIPIELLELIKTGELRVLSFQTSHGVMVFQKRRADDFVSDIHKLSPVVEVHELQK